MYKGLLFDLDGVIVDTAKYHYIAWKELADQLDLRFTKEDNERLKGVSRLRSLEIILEINGCQMDEEEKLHYCIVKNDIYLSYIQQMNQDEVLPGIRTFLQDARRNGYRIALGSASKNALLILNRLYLTDHFDAIIDGTKVTRAKPDPEVFIKGAQALYLPAKSCIVFEDSAAGIDAAHAGGMKAVGIGLQKNLPMADLIIPGFENILIGQIETSLSAVRSISPGNA